MSSFADFITQTRRELQESTAVVWADSSLITWANEAFEDFARKTRLTRAWATGTSAASTSAYALPAGAIEVDTFLYSTGRLERVDDIEYQSLAVVATSNGTPSKYTVIGASIYLHPTPSVAKTYRFRYTAPPAAFTSVADTTATPFAGRHESALRSYIKARAFEQTGEFDVASGFQSLYDREAYETDTERMYDGFGDAAITPRTVW